MEQPPIHIFGILLQEPVTVLTDLMVGLICFLAFRFLSKNRDGERTTIYLGLYFLCTGIGTTLAAITGHGFLYFFGHWGKVVSWIPTMFGLYFLEQFTIEKTSPIFSSTIKKYLKGITVGKLWFFLAVVLYGQNFVHVPIFMGIGFIGIIAILHGINVKKQHHISSLWILFSLVPLIFAALVFGSKFSISPWFNHNDIGHVFMALAAICHFRVAQFHLKEN